MSENVIDKMDPTAPTKTGTVLYEAAMIQATRDLLKAAEARLTRETWGTVEVRQFSYGILCEALSAADDALFNVLNVASSRLDCREAAAAIDRSLGRG